MELAPIVLFAYNRPNHTTLTLEALMQNDLAEKSHLYIYCDGPKIDVSEDDLNNIKAVREIVSKKQWCRKVTVINREKNMGLAASVIKGITEVINDYGKIIVLEDDIITGTGFLRFMNQALNIYEEHKNVFGVSGHTFVENKQLPTTYFLPIGTSWGWATWKRAWDFFEEDTTDLIQKIQYKRNKFDFGSYPYFNMLKMQNIGKVDSWAIRFYASMFINNGLFLFPNISLIENIGVGEESTHIKGNSSFLPRLSNKVKSININQQEPSLIKNNIKIVESFFHKQNRLSILFKMKHKFSQIFKKTEIILK